MDPLAEFLAECCELSPKFSESASRLYSAYQTWANESGEPSINQASFGRNLTERGILRVKSGNVFRVGIRLLNRTDSDHSDAGEDNHGKAGKTVPLPESTVQTVQNGPETNLLPV